MGSQFTVQINDVTLEPGRVIGGRYTLTEHLGQGGFAQVFKAHDTRIERDVAIKCLNLHSRNTERMGETIIDRFEQEAKLAAQISHPGVVNIFDYGVLGDAETVPYIVMELLDGWDLDEELHARGPMHPERALPLFVTCLEALGRAHRKNIVHKDLKPANLFLANPTERDEALRVVDFGIAHMRTAVENRLTNTGEILGTPQYLAPEYIERQDVSPALDVYQMGLVLLETLTGEPGVSRDHHLLTLKAHSSGEIDVPVMLLESPLAPVLMKAMALDPSDRYEDGLAFADALAEVDPQLVPTVPRGAPKRRLVGAAGMSRDRADAATVPVQTEASAHGSEPDHTKTVLYVLVAGLAAAVLMAGLAAAALLGSDDPEPTDQDSSATAVPASADEEKAGEQEGGDGENDEVADRREDDEKADKAAGKPDKPGKHDKHDKGKAKGKKKNKPPKKVRDRLEKVKEDTKKIEDGLKGVGEVFEGFRKK